MGHQNTESLETEKLVLEIIRSLEKKEDELEQWKEEITRRYL